MTRRQLRRALAALARKGEREPIPDPRVVRQQAALAHGLLGYLGAIQPKRDEVDQRRVVGLRSRDLQDVVALGRRS